MKKHTKEQEFNGMLPEDREDETRDEIARQICEGNTSGRLDCEDGTKTYWELKLNTWKD